MRCSRCSTAARSRYKQQAAEEAWAQSVAQYRSTVLVAFQNVADVLRALQADARALSAAVTAEQAAARSIDLVRGKSSRARSACRSCSTPSRPICRRRWRAYRREAARLADTVALFQALGGGWWNRWEATIVPAGLDTAMKQRASRVSAGIDGPRRLGDIGRRRSCALAAIGCAALLLLGAAAGCLRGLAGGAGVRRSLAEKGDTVRRLRPTRCTSSTSSRSSCARFACQKPAIGQIAFNEDASTVVLTPFSGRVTRLIAKIGDEVKRGDPLFEIDSPEVVQAQTDLIAAVQALDKSKSQLALAKRVLDRQTGLFADQGHLAARARAGARRPRLGRDRRQDRRGRR